MNHCPSNLTDNQWQVIEKFLDVQVRKRKYSLRSSALSFKRLSFPPCSFCAWKAVPKFFAVSRLKKILNERAVGLCI